MSRVLVRVLGGTEVVVAGEDVRPARLVAAVLIRLLIAEGDPVGVDEIYADVWGHTVRPGRPERVAVQKRVLELRKLFDRAADGLGEAVLTTERGEVTAYRLRLGRDEVDLHRFRDLVARARGEPSATAAEHLRQALDLWRGRPLFDVERAAFAKRTIQQLGELRRDARVELVRAYRHLGRSDLALTAGEDFLHRAPDDSALVTEVRAVRRQAPPRSPDLFRREFPELSTRVRGIAGDLFDQDDAQLVAGFSDTFDTAADDWVISRASVQGQLLDRVYAGDVRRLDRALAAGLRNVSPVRTESRTDKPRGKRRRYPIGTVVPLQENGQRYYAMAYSTMGNDLVALSSLDDIRRSLENLWDALYRFGQRNPVALPLIGSGLSRVDSVDRGELIRTTITSFVEHSRRRLIATELRIVIRPGEVDVVPSAELGTFLEQLR